MKTSNQIKEEIITHLGFFPPLLVPALETPSILESLWSQTLSNYINNPLPALFKEKLFVLVSRYCSNPYFVICHSCNLRSLGITAKEILALNKLSIPQQEKDVSLDLQYLSQQSHLCSYWQSNSQLERSLLRCAALLFTQPSQAKGCCLKLRECLNIVRYNHIVAFLGYIKLCHQWIESHPEISYEKDQRSQFHLAPLLLEELDLANFFKGNNKLTSTLKVNPQEINSASITYLNKSKKIAEIYQERFENCFLNAPFPMMIYNLDGKVMHLNKSWSEITGYTVAEIPTIADWKKRSQIKQQEIVRSPKLALETEATFDRIVTSLLKSPYEIEVKPDHKNVLVTTRSEVTITTSSGEKRFWDFYSAPFSRFANGTELLISMAKDITNLIQAETQLAETERALQLVLETSKSQLWHWNVKTGVVTIGDRPMESSVANCDRSILGINPHIFVGSYTSFLDLIHPSDRSAMDYAASKTVKEKQVLDLEYRLIWSEQSIHRVKIQAKPICDHTGKVIEVTGIITKLTTAKQTTTTIQNSEGKIETVLCTSSDVPDLVAVKQTLSERTVQLEAANRELESFSYSVSHDLQAPLRVINGFSQVLWEQYASQLDKQGKHYLQRIRANSERMSELIDALLQLSRVARCQIQRMPVNLSAIATEIAEELKAHEPARQVEFQITPELSTKGDPRLLRIVLNNLFNNAWKYTSKKEQAIIEFDSINQPKGKITFLVKDNGAGFDNDYKDKLFVPFQRLHLETEFTGTGIGLATVQRIIYRHGGQVWAEGNINKGATFYFCL